MKVLILYPELQSFSHKALGISLLTGILNEARHEIDFFDSSMYDQTRVLPDSSMATKEKTILYWFKKTQVSLPKIQTLHLDVIEAFNEKLKKSSPDVVLVSSTYLSHPIAIKIIQQSNVGKTPVIFGGIHCTLSPEDAIKSETVQIMHVGEGEKSLPIILEAIAKGNSLRDCPNLWLRKGSEVIKNPMIEMVTNLDELPFYNWDHYSDFHYARVFCGKVYRMGDYAISRGCVNRCSYCFNKLLYDAYGIKGKVRRYSPERAIEELVYLKEKYRINFIKFHDSDFLNMSANYMDRFSKLYKKHVDLPNTVNGCVEHVTEAKAEYLVRMNCQSISIGIESGNQELREKVLNRGKYSNQSFIENTHLLKKYGIRVSAPCMIGLPDETRENIMETIQIAKKAKVDHADFGIFFPFPHLPLTNYAIEKGYLSKNRRLDNIIFGVESALDLKISHQALNNLLRCSMLYLKLPYFFWPLVRVAEKYNTDDGIMWQLLRKAYFLKLNFFDISSIIRNLKRKFVTAQ